MSKLLDQAGVQRLWTAIEAKFVDADELAAALQNIEGVTIEALTNADIDAITGYVAPVENNNDPE